MFKIDILLRLTASEYKAESFDNAKYSYDDEASVYRIWNDNVTVIIPTPNLIRLQAFPVECVETKRRAPTTQKVG